MHPITFEVRTYEPEDLAEIYQLFYDTVHAINSKDYNQKQIDAWAPKAPDLQKWQTSLRDNFSFVAIDVDTKKIIGFSDLQKDGSLNRGYVHKEYIGLGIGKALLKVREDKARSIGLHHVTSAVSITAKPFFLSQGYAVVKEQTVKIGDVAFTNFLMTKEL